MLTVAQLVKKFLLSMENKDYHVHNSPPLVPFLTQTNPVHIFWPYFSKTHSNGLFLSGFSIKILFTFLTSPMCATCPTHLHPPWFDHLNNILRRVQIMKLPWNFLQPPDISFLLDANIIISILSQTPSIYVLHLMSEIKFYTHTKWQNYSFIYFNFYLPPFKFQAAKLTARF